MWVNGQWQYFIWTPTFGLISFFSPLLYIHQVGVWNWEACLYLHTQRQILLQGVKGLSLKEITHCCDAFGSTACQVPYFTWGRYLCFTCLWRLVNYSSFVICVWSSRYSWMGFQLFYASHIWYTALDNDWNSCIFDMDHDFLCFRDICWTKQW